MTSNEIRDSFLKYFERKKHRIVRSASLVPHDDPTLLFTNAGMNQFKDLFLGKERRDYKRATTSQKCMRVSASTTTWTTSGRRCAITRSSRCLALSFGDYFKEEAIGFAWELLTDIWNIAPEKLHATVFSGEGGIPRDEARQHWLRFLPAERITELGLADNFWQMGETGPCGRCSRSIFSRRGPSLCGAGLQRRGVQLRPLRGDLEQRVRWNSTARLADSSARSAPSIGTGMGLERITAVLQGVSNYDTDLFTRCWTPLARSQGVPTVDRRLPSDASFASWPTTCAR